MNRIKGRVIDALLTLIVTIVLFAIVNLIHLPHFLTTLICVLIGFAAILLYGELRTWRAARWLRREIRRRITDAGAEGIGLYDLRRAVDHLCGFSKLEEIVNKLSRRGLITVSEPAEVAIGSGTGRTPILRAV